MLNPVAVGMVARAADWPWSFRYTAGMDSTPTFLTLSDVWQMFDPADRAHAQHSFQRSVDGDTVCPEPPGGLVMGSDGFVRSFEPLLSPHRENRELTHSERFAARPSLRDLFPNTKRGLEVQQAASSAFHVHAFTLREIAEHVGVTVGGLGLDKTGSAGRVSREPRKTPSPGPRERVRPLLPSASGAPAPSHDSQSSRPSTFKLGIPVFDVGSDLDSSPRLPVKSEPNCSSNEVGSLEIEI